MRNLIKALLVNLGSLLNTCPRVTNLEYDVENFLLCSSLMMISTYLPSQCQLLRPSHKLVIDASLHSIIHSVDSSPQHINKGHG